MAFRLVALDKRPGVRPVGIGETLRQALAKLVMRAAGEQAKRLPYLLAPTDLDRKSASRYCQ